MRGIILAAIAAAVFTTGAEARTHREKMPLPDGATVNVFMVKETPKVRAKHVRKARKHKIKKVRKPRAAIARPAPPKQTAKTPPRFDELVEIALKTFKPIPEIIEAMVVKPSAEALRLIEVATARDYLVRTATAGGTMSRQGPAVAIGRLHPMFATRLAGAIREAREKGLDRAGVFSAYRPPAFGIGGMRDKAASLHAYGLAVDMCGIGRPGSKESRLWFAIAGRHKIFNPYGPSHRAEWNHYQPTFTKAVAKKAPLRATITARGPVDPEKMWKVALAMIR